MQSTPDTTLSLPIETLIENGTAWRSDTEKPDSAIIFDLIIVGSGYGGSVAAARFANATENTKPLNLAVFERGREIPSGRFPNTFAQLPGEVRIQNYDSDKVVGNAEALFDLRLGKTVNVLLANGLGGGSLINAAVTEEPHPSVWAESSWPTALQQSDSMEKYFSIAKKSLGAKPINSWNKPLPTKLKSMEQLSDQLGGKHYRTVDIAIDGKLCTQCGDCITGCNLNAKNTLPKTYLAQAKENGAALYNGVTVSHISRVLATEKEPENTWLIHFVLTNAKGHPSHQQTWAVKTRHIILSAGTLGSTEILQRSQTLNTDLEFSTRLGKSFSCNGDMIWSGYDQHAEVNAIADPATAINARDIGPTIASMIDLRDEEVAHVIQDASIPGALKRVFEEMTTTSATTYRMVNRDKEERNPHQDEDAVDPDKLKRTAVYLSMGKDKATGIINFRSSTPKSNTGIRGRAEVNWGEELDKDPRPDKDTDNVCNDDVYKKTEESLAAVNLLGGTLIPNPLLRAVPQNLLDQLSGRQRLASTLTVHPLGGCGMGEDCDSGVVNHFGAVFTRTSFDSQATHRGLYVLDGAIIPTSLGINPLLTITALAERAVAYIAQRENWVLTSAESIIAPSETKQAPSDYNFPPTANIPIAAEQTAFKFQEIMESTKDDPHTAALMQQLGLKDVSSVTLIVNFHIGKTNLAAFLRNPKRIVDIEDAHLLIKLNNGKPVRFDIEGKVHWLWERHETIYEKITHGFKQYLRSRAEADLFSRNEASAFKKWLAILAIRIVNKYDINFRGWLINLLCLNSKLKDLLALASHTGGHRILRYELWDKDGNIHLVGQKDVNYGDGSNLWRSISEMDIKLTYNDQTVDGLKLCLNWNKIFESNSFQVDPPSHGLARNPDVWIDLISVFSFFSRSLLRIHFWSFRLPEVQKNKRNHSLPRSESSIWHPLNLMDSHGNEIQIGATHFPCTNPRQELPPVLLIHGFGASGLQFFAPAMDTTLVAHLHEQGRDVWVAELRTSIALNRELSDDEAQWTLDEVAQEDIPALIKYVLQKTHTEKIDILAHCIGSAMFNVAVLSGKLMNDNNTESLIRRAALLQVGPIFTVSKDNKLRAYFAYFLGRGFDLKFIDSTTDDSAESAANALVDRLLNSYPVPRTEIHSDTPEKCLSPVHPGNEWQANYFRSSGVFGRLFQIGQMSAAMLEQLGNLIGRTNFKTFQQIIQSIMRNRLVDIDGRNIYVSQANFNRYYNFPVCFFHGSKNDVFSAQGVIDSVQQLRSAHGYNLSAQEHPEDTFFSWKNLDDFGHLDPLVGHSAPTKTFPEFSSFLNKINPEKNSAEVATIFNLREPDYGPIVGWTRQDNNGEWISRVWLLARETAGTPLYAVAYKVANRQLIPHSVKVFPIQQHPQFKYITIDLKGVNAEEEYRFTIIHHGSSAGSGSYQETIQTTRIPLARFTQNHSGSKNISPNDILSAVETYLPSTPQTPLEEEIEQKISFDNKKIYKPASPVVPPTNTDDNTIRIALGSCRYSGTMVELVRGNHSYDELHNILEEGNYSPHFMLLMGDQIYADATAGVADATEISAILSFYHRSMAKKYNSIELSAAKVFSKLPAYMMLDDHEIKDNWNSTDDTNKNAQALSNMAKSAFTAFQWSHGPRNPNWPVIPFPADSQYFWYSFSHKSVDIFVMDTRLERTPAIPINNSKMISDTQFDALEKWLQATENQHRLRLIVSPSQIKTVDEDHPLRSDSWSTYPNSLKKLCDILANQKDIGILCGDQHLHGLYSIDYYNQSNNLEKSIPVIVASPLYAPYPFANPQIEVSREISAPLTTRCNGQQINYRVIDTNSNYQGFAQLVIERSQEKWQANLYKVDGKTNLYTNPAPIIF